MNIVGIYSIRNIINDKKYIGSTTNLKTRYTQHKSKLRHKKHCNLHLQNAWNKYGEKSFVYEILENCNIDVLLKREEFWIKKLNSHINKNGYNFSEKPRSSRLGCKASPETIIKMKIALGGKNHPNWGKKMSKKWIRRMIKSVTGIKKPNSGKKKEFIIIDKLSNEIKIVGIRKFCRDNNLSVSSIWRVISGKKLEYNGWKCKI